MSMDMETVPAVRVHVASVGDGVSLGSVPKKHKYQGVYTTFVLTVNDPVQCILPEDDTRVEAFVLALDNDVIIGTKGQAQAAANTVSSVPQPIGAYVPAKTTAGALYPYPIKDCEAVYAGVTTTSSSSRVSVMAYYRC